MLNIVFYPDSNKEELTDGAKEYQTIWANEGNNIYKKISKISRLTFIEQKINAIVYRGISFDYPLSLRADLSTELKKETLIHELCHRLLRGNKLAFKGPQESYQVENHKRIFLILYDVWLALYGNEFAKRQVIAESSYHEYSKEAWNWALQMTYYERQSKFQTLTGQNNFI